MNTRQFVNRDKMFHHHIAVASGNIVFIWFIDLLQKVLAKGQLIHARGDHAQLVISEHERILDAIQARDPEMARAQMLAHLTLSKAYTHRQAGIELRVSPVNKWAPRKKSRGSDGSF
jgi:DNA-binding FadR family transcriptional regulator